MISLFHANVNSLVRTQLLFLIKKDLANINIYLDYIDLKLLPVSAFDPPYGISESEWIQQYVRPSFSKQFERNIPWELGKSWNKKTGFNKLPAPDKGVSRTVADLFQKDGLYEWEVSDGKIVVWINFYIDESSSQVRTSPLRKVQRVKKIKEETKASPVLDPACFESSPPRTSIEPASQSIESELFFSQSPEIASQEDSSQSLIHARTTMEPEALESGPAYHTRRIHQRRPAQKRKRSVREA